MPKFLKVKGFFDPQLGEMIYNPIIKWDDDLSIHILTTPLPPSVKIKQIKGYITTPFFDLHTHLFLTGSSEISEREKVLKEDKFTTENRIEENIENYKKYGIIGVRDAGDNLFAALDMSKKISDFTIIPSGKAIFKKGRYGSFIGEPFTDKKSLIAILNSLNSKGAQVLKIINSGINSVDKFGNQTTSQFTYDEFKLLSDFAKNNDLKVMVHANGEEAIKMAASFGVTSIEHGFFMGEDNIKLMIDNNVSLIPTFAAMFNLIYNKAFTNKQKEVIKKTTDHHIDEVRQFLELGGRLNLGTDAGSFGMMHGESIFDEIKFFHKSIGLSFEEILKIVSYDNLLLAGVTIKRYPFLIFMDQFNYQSLSSSNSKTIQYTECEN